MNLLVPGIAGWLGRCNDQHAKTQCKYCEIPFCLLDKFFFKESTVNHRSDQQYKENNDTDLMSALLDRDTLSVLHPYSSSWSSSDTVTFC